MTAETLANAPPGRAEGGRRPLMFYGWYIVVGAVIAQFVSAGVQAYVIGVFFLPMTEDLGWTRTQFTLAQTIGQLFTAGAGFFVGAQIDRRGARPLMLVGVTVMAGGLFLSAEVTQLWQWILLRGMMVAVGSAMVGSLVVNVTLSKWFVERRGRAVGIAATGTSIAGVLLPPFTTAIVDTFGWQMGWRVLGVLTLLLIYPTATFMRRQPEDHGLHPDGKSDQEVASGRAGSVADFARSFTRGEALRTRSFYLVVMAYGFAAAGLVTVLLQLIPYLTDNGYSRGVAALAISLNAIPAAITKPLWGLLAERIHARILSAVSFAILAGGMVMLVLVVRTGAVLPVLAVSAWIGVGWGGMIPLQETVWGSYFGRRHLGSVRSAALPLTLVISGSAPLLASLYFDRVGNYEGAFFALAGTWSIAAVLVLLATNPPLPARLRQAAGASLAPTPTPTPTPTPGSAPPPLVAAAALAPPAPRAPAAPAAAATVDGGAPAATGPPRRPPRDYMNNGLSPPARDYMQPNGDGLPARARDGPGAQSER